MISVEEARTLYEKSGVEVNNYLNFTVSPAVVKAAEGGSRSVFIMVDSVPLSGSSEKIKTPVHVGVMDKLKELGYTVHWSSNGDSYVPRGLADDDGKGPSYVNVGIYIRW